MIKRPQAMFHYREITTERKIWHEWLERTNWISINSISVKAPWQIGILYSPRNTLNLPIPINPFPLVTEQNVCKCKAEGIDRNMSRGAEKKNPIIKIEGAGSVVNAALYTAACNARIPYKSWFDFQLLCFSAVSLLIFWKSSGRFPECLSPSHPWRGASWSSGSSLSAFPSLCVFLSNSAFKWINKCSGKKKNTITFWKEKRKKLSFLLNA